MSKTRHTDAIKLVKVDIGQFMMIADFYDRKCPCWGGKLTCPCPPFAETQNCKCEAVLPIGEEPKKGKTGNFKLYNINFDQVSKIIYRGYKCVGDDDLTCFCDEFMENGICKYKVFDKIDSTI